ncbi:Uncharacterised protein [Clostridioides difficile]|uniref:hypothetical protein n=1 Tax=Clostridioides difficile TaxID=1496 RepID=UPI00098004E3|nr:hypothetical protein [Clostridioides difficile]EJA6675901.1 hypothetical protein [Clostridioides difficile]MCG3625914.1 hypothetical protein [Clostridioides difficile]MDC9402944.1 hypothetical protein [Clostridioides difficile]MDE3364773.1 hypothetical protein [Clostridioides difficile]MDI6119119.1 hypothetical protein [Clostridioides difficile]
MFKILKTILIIIWVVDILNFPQFQFLDTTYPINTLAWLLIWILIPSSSIYIDKKE